MEPEKPSAGALRAAVSILEDWDISTPSQQDLARRIDQQTHLQELIEAAEEMDRLYGNLWDTTDGGGFVSPESLPKYDAAFEKLRNALSKAKGE